jgi:hypothetical protein
MQNIIDNYINGNLTEAKKLARNKTIAQLGNFMVQELGFTGRRAGAIALYLKGRITFQTCCDIEFEEKQKH